MKTKTLLFLSLVLLVLVSLAFTNFMRNNTHVKVTTISDNPQTIEIKCIDYKNVTDSLIKREALYYDNTEFIDSVPKGYELDKAYYEKMPNSNYYHVVVYNKVKIEK